MFRQLLIVGLLVVSSGCASTSMRYSGVLATAAENTSFHEAPGRQVALNDRVVIVTDVAWPEAENGGVHAVRWNWYEGETLVAARFGRVEFTRTPCRFWRSLPATDLGTGHYRVEVLVDGRRVDRQAFDVVAR